MSYCNLCGTEWGGTLPTCPAHSITITPTGAVYPAQDCPTCVEKDAEIERLKGELHDTCLTFKHQESVELQRVRDNLARVTQERDTEREKAQHLNDVRQVLERDKAILTAERDEVQAAREQARDYLHDIAAPLFGEAGWEPRDTWNRVVSLLAERNALKADHDAEFARMREARDRWREEADRLKANADAREEAAFLAGFSSGDEYASRIYTPECSDRPVSVAEALARYRQRKENAK